MNKKKIYPFEETDMWDLITDFKEYSTDYTKSACEYYEEYLRKYQLEKLKLQNNWNELKEYILEDSWSSVNGEITSKLILNKMQELEGKSE